MTTKDAAAAPFWRTKTLDEMDRDEWESLCDGCARCCLVKLEDEDTGDIHFTDIGCRLLDAKTCRCRDYARRNRRVPDCVRLSPSVVRALTWLPVTCAYRLVAEGKDLPDWHPLVSGRADSVHEAGVSVRGRVVAGEDDLAQEFWPDRIVKWPNRAPRKSR
ncbi:MAG TPA: YcgN family cysteine cluster protein [Roseiarcus sp.]|nr:YcgN family cysteine cluster protein [Roseiarcus sp.]